MNTTVPTGEPKGYAVTAAALRQIADGLDTLPPGDKPPYLQVSILPNGTVEDVDAVAFAVLGKRGKTEPAEGGKWRHIANGGSTLVGSNAYISIHALVPGPPDERDAEIERLRSELAKLHAETDTTGDSFSREPDEVKPTSAVPNGVDGHSEFSGRASVPDGDSDSAIYAKFAAAEAANNEQVKAWLDRHGITVVGAPAVSLRRGLAADHGEALAFAQLLGEPDDSRPCAHRGDSDDCECNGNDQPQGGE